MKLHGIGTFAALAAALFSPLASAAWEPTKTVEFIVPAGTGGGADQMARAIQGIIAKHALMKQSMVVVNKAGGAGATRHTDSGDEGEEQDEEPSFRRDASPRAERTSAPLAALGSRRNIGETTPP